MVKRLYSKRNRVYKINGYVVKIVKSPQAAKEEAIRLRLLYKKGLAVPRVIFRIKNIIILEYIAARPLIECLEDSDIGYNEIKKLADALANWLWGFYKVLNSEKTKVILADVNCRNFIGHGNGEISTVDFESFGHGEIIENIGEIIAFISLYDLPYNNKRIFAEVFLEDACKKLSLDKAEVLNKSEHYKKLITNRRKLR